jgi:hypothetical protein
MAEKAKKPQRETNKLAALNLKRLRPGLHGDGGGLWLQVTPNRRRRSWVFRYSFNGRAREMGLGSFDTIGLADAREYATQCRKLLKGSPTTPPVDPIEHRRSARRGKAGGDQGEDLQRLRRGIHGCAPRRLAQPQACRAMAGDAWYLRLSGHGRPSGRCDRYRSRHEGA